MRRLLALAALAAAVAPATAEAVAVCPGVGGTRPTFVCVGVELNGDGNTVNPSYGAGCIVLGDPCKSIRPREVGTTGIADDGSVYVAGMVVL